MKVIYFSAITLLLVFSISSCSNQIKEAEQIQEVKNYENEIGDTPFDKALDNPNFKFCDSTDVLHKRAFVRYEGGLKAYRKELLELYKFKPSYASFTGTFVVRFLVNCKDETDRFRVETLDANFHAAKTPDDLEEHIRLISSQMKGWRHPVYDDKDYDGYRFVTIKMVKGQIQFS